MSLHELKFLIEKYQAGTCTEAEKKMLYDWYTSFEYEKSTMARTEKLSAIKENAWTVLKDQMAEVGSASKVVPMQSNKTRWWMAAAAVVLVLLGYIIITKTGTEKKISPGPLAHQSASQDVAPGGNKAILTLADGSTIVLDSAANGNLARQGNIKVIKIDGRIAYNNTGSGSGVGGTVHYNTITTPRGGQYQLILADGSKVWLNAASSLRFPASFVGKERRVELTGEGYFEIAKNAATPFKVNVAGRGEVEVLGTHFNINAYKDEPYINTALLEGSVKFSALSPGQNAEAKTLLPGEQVRLDAVGKVTLSDDEDVQQAIAWKTGVFNFSNANLQTVLRQLARWYNVDVKFEGQVPDRAFSGKMQMNLNLSQVLRLLENNNVRFRIKRNDTGDGTSQLIVTK